MARQFLLHPGLLVFINRCLGSPTAAPRSSRFKQRRVYLDLGANWANTLRLYRDLVNASRLPGPWEIYAFEASPFMVPYLEEFVTWLNGKGLRPALLWPPSGSSTHLDRYASRYGCSRSRASFIGEAVVPDWEMRACMWKVFWKPLQMLRNKTAIARPAVIQERLATAGRALAPDASDRFVVVPAAVGASAGKLSLGMMTPEQAIRGGAHSAGPLNGARMKVPLVDLVAWIARHFKVEDYIVVKMDIEGAEFDVLNALLDRQQGHLVDVLAFECHKIAGDCAGLSERLRVETRIRLLHEGKHYEGWDSFSTPENYFPIDPRGALTA